MTQRWKLVPKSALALAGLPECTSNVLLLADSTRFGRTVTDGFKLNNQWSQFSANHCIVYREHADVSQLL